MIGIEGEFVDEGPEPNTSLQELRTLDTWVDDTTTRPSRVRRAFTIARRKAAGRKRHSLLVLPTRSTSTEPKHPRRASTWPSRQHRDEDSTATTNPRQLGAAERALSPFHQCRIYYRQVLPYRTCFLLLVDLCGHRSIL